MIMQYKNIIPAVLSMRQIIDDETLRHHIKTKGLADYVTMVDISVQKELKQILSDLYPEIQFIGEEEQSNPVLWNGLHWVLDPIDGTTNLIHDYPQFTVSLGLYDGKTGIFGIVYAMRNRSMLSRQVVTSITAFISMTVQKR